MRYHVAKEYVFLRNMPKGNKVFVVNILQLGGLDKANEKDIKIKQNALLLMHTFSFLCINK